MKQILTYTDVFDLKVNQEIIELYEDNIYYYKFICYYSEIPKDFVILLDRNGMIQKIKTQNLFLGFYFINYTKKDILNLLIECTERRLRNLKKELEELNKNNKF